MATREQIREWLANIECQIAITEPGGIKVTQKIGHEVADYILRHFHSQGLMIVRKPYPGEDLTGCVIVAVEPLIKEE